jgi:Domain of unknown function (DUF4431)
VRAFRRRTIVQSILKITAILFLLVVVCCARNCFKYGVSTRIEGTLSLRDEAGYNQFILLKPLRPICAEVDTKTVHDPKDEYYRRQDGVQEVQAGVYGSDAAADTLRDRLRVLTGHKVIIKGDLFPATTGYDRTNLQLRVESVDAADTAGQQALLRPRVPFRPRDVDAYDITIHAGARLVIDARESGSASPLVPPDQYASHWMTAGEVVYVECRDGYERKLISNSDENGGICVDGDLCGFSAFPKKPVVIEFRCTKKQ